MRILYIAIALLCLAPLGIAIRASWVRVRERHERKLQRKRWMGEDSRALLPNPPNYSPTPIVVLLVFLIVGAWFTFRIIKNRQGSGETTLGLALTTVDIAATPEGAEVVIDGKISGKSVVHAKLAPGSHTISANAPGYESQTIPLVLGPEPKTITLELMPLPMDLRVVTDQATGSVWLDEELKGNLTSDGIVIAGVTPGAHTLKVRSAGGEVTTGFEFRPGQLPVPQSLPTARSPAVLFIGSSDQKSHVECNCAPARLRIGDQDQALEKGGLEIELPEGEHAAELSVMGGKKLTIEGSRVPAATVALYWGPRASAPAPTTEVLLREASAMIENRQYPAAMARINQVLSKNPSDDRATVLKKRLDRLMAIDQ